MKLIARAASLSPLRLDKLILIIHLGREGRGEESGEGPPGNCSWSSILTQFGQTFPWKMYYTTPTLLLRRVKEVPHLSQTGLCKMETRKTIIGVHACTWKLTSTLTLKQFAC